MLVHGRAGLLAATITSLAGSVAPPVAAAHAFGPFSISVSSQLTVAEGEIRVRWVVDMAEAPAGVLIDLIDTDGDGGAQEAERAAYLVLWIPSVLDNLELVVNDVALLLEEVTHELSFPPGEGGAPALRLVADMVAPLPSPDEVDVHHSTYSDTNYTDYIGWREVAVSAAEGVSLLASSVPVEGRTQGLTVYPADLGVSVPSSEAYFAFSFVGAQVSAAGLPTASGRDQASADPSFRVWPTGVLALVAVLLLGLAVVVTERPATGRRRR